MFVIFGQFKNGTEGYFNSVNNNSVYYDKDYNYAQKYPSYSSAVSKAKWLKRFYNCVGRTEVISLQ